MTNDEKILEILMQMQSDISDLKTGQAKLEQDVSAVSYTHLTLPTICSV